MKDEDLKIIALSELAAGLDAKAAGMAGFREFALRRLPPAERKVLDRYQDAKARVAPVLAGLWDDFEKTRK